ncbi:MAG: hypothetical protein AB1758_27485, partial [Candidatus Eremiobacterota bacterium]
EPGGAGWLHYSEAGATRRVVWAVGTQGNALWLVLEAEPTLRPLLAPVPTASVDEPDPEAGNDGIDWDSE